MKKIFSNGISLRLESLKQFPPKETLDQIRNVLTATNATHLLLNPSAGKFKYAKEFIAQMWVLKNRPDLTLV